MSSFTFPFNDTILAKIINNKEYKAWFLVLEEILPKYNITNVRRVAAFLAQTTYESNDFHIVEENMNYSAERAAVVFKNHFPTVESAKPYAHNPKLLANKVYASKSLGNVNSGDGYLFIGRGLIQLTGRYNYTQFGKSINKSAEEVVEYIKTKKGSVEAAAWFWNSRGLNSLADVSDFSTITSKINAARLGLEHRKEKYNKLLQLLGGVISIGSKGDCVKRLQKLLKIEADGDFGPITERAFKNWQKANGMLETGSISEELIMQLTKNV